MSCFSVNTADPILTATDTDCFVSVMMLILYQYYQRREEAEGVQDEDINFEPAVEELQLQVSATLANGLHGGLQSFNEILEINNNNNNKKSRTL